MSQLIHTIQKNIGETPLMAMERFRNDHPEFHDEPMTYAGRLDPMASGLLLILIGDECKNKEKYLDMDKVYVVEILFGITTDTYDMLGIPELCKNYNNNLATVSTNILVDWKKYVGRFSQAYPAYSSKTVNGVQLHNLARSNELPEEMPTKEVEIHEIQELAKFNLTASELLEKYVSQIDLVKGDFRQDEIKTKWKELLSNSGLIFSVLKIQVLCSSGTYMRSLANRVGKDLGIGALAISISRTKLIDKK